MEKGENVGGVAGSRRSSRSTNGSISWVDSKPCLSVNQIHENLQFTESEWNLYVCPFEDIRHALVVHKDAARRCFEIYDYQGDRVLEHEQFPTTLLYKRLKKHNPLKYRVAMGQHNEIMGADYDHLCMKNSAFVMKFRCAPADKSFTKPYRGEGERAAAAHAAAAAVGTTSTGEVVVAREEEREGRGRKRKTRQPLCIDLTLNS